MLDALVGMFAVVGCGRLCSRPEVLPVARTEPGQLSCRRLDPVGVFKCYVYSPTCSVCPQRLQQEGTAENRGVQHSQ